VGSHEEVHICSLENEFNLLRFNLPIYPIYRRPKSGEVIVTGGLVQHNGGSGGGDGESQVLVVGYNLSDSGACHRLISRELIGRLESKGERLTWRERGSRQVKTSREAVLVQFRQVQLPLALGGIPQGTYTYRYTGWFITFDLVKYKLILGQDFMEEVEHHINHHENDLDMDWDETTKG
jgi:hypothetical protein